MGGFDIDFEMFIDIDLILRGKILISAQEDRSLPLEGCNLSVFSQRGKSNICHSVEGGNKIL